MVQVFMVTTYSFEPCGNRILFNIPGIYHMTEPKNMQQSELAAIEITFQRYFNGITNYKQVFVNSKFLKFSLGTTNYFFLNIITVLFELNLYNITHTGNLYQMLSDSLVALVL